MRKLLFSLLIFGCYLSKAQQSTIEKPYIEVIGTAAKEVMPDKIFIEIIISEKTIDKKTYPIEQQEAKLKTIIENLSIDLNKLNLADSNSKIIYKRYREKGIAKRKVYHLEVNSVSVLNDLFTRLNNAEIKTIDIIKTEHSEIVELRKKVRIEAIKIAKAKAKYLLEAIDEELGKPIKINELNTLNSDNITLVSQSNRTLNTYNSYERHNNSNDNLNFKPIEIKFSYYVKYEIK